MHTTELFALQIYVAYIEMWPWTTKPVISSTGIFVAIEKIHCMGQNDPFFFYAKNRKDIK